MTISTGDVLRMAQLSRLAINENEIPDYAEQLSRILDFVAQMNAVDTRDIEPLAHPQDLVQRLRADKVTEQDAREDFQSQAPATANGYYLVPQVID